jgi:hypothetical protein
MHAIAIDAKDAPARCPASRTLLLNGRAGLLRAAGLPPLNGRAGLLRAAGLPPLNGRAGLLRASLLAWHPALLLRRSGLRHPSLLRRTLALLVEGVLRHSGGDD